MYCLKLSPTKIGVSQNLMYARPSDFSCPVSKRFQFRKDKLPLFTCDRPEDETCDRYPVSTRMSNHSPWHFSRLETSLNFQDLFYQSFQRLNQQTLLRPLANHVYLHFTGLFLERQFPSSISQTDVFERKKYPRESRISCMQARKSNKNGKTSGLSTFRVLSYGQCPPPSGHISCCSMRKPSK